MTIKCYGCGKVFPDNEIIVLKDYDGGDVLKCPKCGEVEPGFAEVKSEND